MNLTFRLFHYSPICSLLLFLLFPVQPVVAQDYSLRNYTVKEGLPSQEVYCSLQDHQGRLWFGTDAGVSVYNGFHFKNYSTKDGLLDNSVFAMCQDSSNRIWFGTMNRKLFYFENNRFVPVLNRANDTLHITTNNIIKMYTLNGLLYFNTSYKTYFVEQDGNRFRLDSVKSDLEKKVSIVISRIEKGIYSTVLNRKMFNGDKLKLALVKGSKVIYYDLPHSENQVFTMFWTVQEFGDSVLYSLGKKVYLLKSDGTFLAVTMPKDIYSSERSGNQVIFRSEEFGERYFNLSDFSTPVKTNFNNYTISSSLCDHEGGFWITTLENGVYYSTSLNKVNYLPDPVNNINIKKINVINNQLWIGTKNGVLMAFDSPDKIGLQNRASYKTSDGNVLYDFETNGKEFFVATRTGLYIFQIENNKLVAISNDYKTRFRDISNPVGDNCYGIARANIYKVTQGKVVLEKTDGIPEAFNCFARGDSLYLGGTNGLYVFRNNKIYKVPVKGFNNNEHIHVIEGDRDGSLYLGTEESGLIIIRKGIVTIVNKTMGLIDNNVSAIVRPNDSVIWVSTKRGVSKIVLLPGEKTGHIDNFDVSNGLINDNITSLAYFKNHLCFGTKSGFFTIHEKDLKPNSVRPQIFIDQIENMKVAGSSSVFSYLENDVKLHISVSSFRNAGNIPVKYKLRKEDTTFYYQIISNGTLTLLQLEPGEYEVTIYTSNNNNVWSGKPAIVRFTISKPFWRENYFWIILTLVTIVFVGFFARFRVRKITRREKEKAEFEIQIENLKNQALRLQMNPHFLFNALNAIQGFYANEDKAMAKNYIYNLSRLLRLILESSKEDTISLGSEIEIIRCYLDLTKLRFEDKLEYNIHVAENIQVTGILIPPMITQPFIENAFLHGIAPMNRKGWIDVEFSIENNLLLCTISDNGIGRKAASEKKLVSIQRSSGINITRERIALLNKKHDALNTVEIQDLFKNGEPSGTRVVLKLTIKKADHAESINR